ncbi:MAG: 4Fe-4S dicluster domain-containing protein [Dehalococcoidales bacterium]
MEDIMLNDTNDRCTLCKKCVGICRKTVGREAISYVEDESGNASIIFDFDKCIACGSCAYVCADNAIIIQDIDDARIMVVPSGRKEFKSKQCTKCGYYWAPEQQIQYMAETANLPLSKFDLCPDCR